MATQNKDKLDAFETIKVGLETHLRLNTKKKLFCNCKRQEEVCDFCRGVAGNMPQKINIQAVEKSLKFLKKTNGSHNQYLVFSRKHYNYHDLLCGYQLTQEVDSPLGREGFINTFKNFRVDIARYQLEEDPAGVVQKMLNFKRIGSPLLEVVTNPCFEGEVKIVIKNVIDYLRTLIRTALDLDIVDKANPMKTDVNISKISRSGSASSFKIEIKNLNSLLDIKKALVEAAKYLKREKLNRDMTFSYKNGLKFSRDKLSYVYLQEPNLEPYDLSKVLDRVNLNLTLAELYPIVDKYLKDNKISNQALSYSFTKLLYNKLPNCQDLLQKIKSNEVEPMETYNFLKNPPPSATEGIAKAIVNWVKIEKVTVAEHEAKTVEYLKKLSRLKNLLIANNLKFNSRFLNEEISKELKKDLSNK